jgi:hypothetical protein
VKPDADSKKALINDGIVSLIRYGSDPKNVNKIQVIVTVRKESLLLIS